MTLALNTSIRQHKKTNFTGLDFIILIFTALLALCLALPLVVDGVWAENAGGVRTLTDMFRTQSFRGSAEALTHANWIGMALHYIISWFSFLGLCLTLYQKFITLLYLSARNLFDTIYEVKVNKMKGSILGYKELLNSLFIQGENGNQGGGIDVFITFMYSLLPNIKAYCDYCPDKLNGSGAKLADTDGVTQYMLKTAIPTITLIFFLTIGYSGTLAQAYGTIVDGMAVAADNLVSRNLAGYVHRLVGEGGGYDFSLASNGTKSGDYAQKVAKEMYNQIMGMCNNTNTEFQQALGKVLEDAISGNGVSASGVSTSILVGDDESNRANVTKLSDATLPLESRLGDGAILSNEELKNLKSPVVYVNNSPTIIGDSGLTWSVKEILAATGIGDDVISKSAMERYIHVLTYRKLQSNANYLIPEAADITVE